MNQPAIKIDSLSKHYKLGKEVRSGGQNDFWALNNISFQVEQGEVVGVVGRNGAGKSTLLKILSRITLPTKGRAVLKGRIASLLEVGTGFHPDLTGRENTYLNGAILGMRKKEIDKKFEAIAAFAEIESFLDTPVKHYSSGMYVRLAFAVAAHLETDILIVDEILAVGDVVFQKKCIGKMEEAAGQGRAVLFVSHNLQTVSHLTKKVAYLDKGKLQFFGDTVSGLRAYRSQIQHTEQGEYINQENKTGVSKVKVITSDPGQIHRFGQPLVFEFEINFKEKPKAAAFSFQIIDEQTQPVIHLSIFEPSNLWGRQGKVVLRCVIQKPRLYMGNYTVTTHLADRASLQKFETVKLICPFSVIMDDVPSEYLWRPGICVYMEEAQWRVT